MDGRHISQAAPGRRRVVMVFQSHAVQPHRNVLGNVALGCRVWGVAAWERHHQRWFDAENGERLAAPVG